MLQPHHHMTVTWRSARGRAIDRAWAALPDALEDLDAFIDAFAAEYCEGESSLALDNMLDYDPGYLQFRAHALRAAVVRTCCDPHCVAATPPRHMLRRQLSAL